jgi:predicted lactoylglutathione lyase
VNLPVKNLDRSVGFYTRLGYTVNPQFTDNNAACIVISDTIHVMLLTEQYFKNFTPKQIADATRTCQVLLALDVPNREEVDAMVRKAVAGGGSTYNQPQDHGFMYQHGFQDPDGHMWEVLTMDMAAYEKMRAGSGAGAD